MGAIRSWLADRLKSAGILYRPTAFTETQLEQIRGLLGEAQATLEQQMSAGQESAGGEPLAVLDFYAQRAPDPQTMLNIFEGEWASQFPDELGQLQAGTLRLFEDVRIDWALSVPAASRDRRHWRLVHSRAAIRTCLIEQAPLGSCRWRLTHARS